MEIHSIETGNWMLDGGGMFGIVPKLMWSNAYPCNENNLINLAMRSLLIIDGDRKILIDTGIGTKQDKRFFMFYYLNGNSTLEGSLAKHHIHPNDITDVVLTHLHFDHVGGAVKHNGSGEPVLAFKNASYWVSEEQWYTANNPNAREKASFLTENFLPIEASGKLKLFSGNYQLTPSVELRLFYGHTAGQIIPFINYKSTKIVYTADLLPSIANIPLAWVPAYDVQPLISLKEKEAFLNEALNNKYVLFFEHDITGECCNLQMTKKGIRDNDVFSLSEVDKYL